MKGVRFYLEHNSPRDKRKGKHNDNVVAVITETGRIEKIGNHYYRCYDALSAVFFQSDSDVATTTVTHEFLQNCCTFVSEMVTRTIHPRLFARLDK